MTTINLSKADQSRLGRQSSPIDVKAQRLRRKALAIATKEQEWLKDDFKPIGRNCLTRDAITIGMQVQELISPHRRGIVCSFAKVFPYTWKLPVVLWQQGYKTAVHPCVLQAIPNHIPEGVADELPTGPQYLQLSFAIELGERAIAPKPKRLKPPQKQRFEQLCLF